MLNIYILQLWFSFLCNLHFIAFIFTSTKVFNLWYFSYYLNVFNIVYLLLNYFLYVVNEF